MGLVCGKEVIGVIHLPRLPQSTVSMRFDINDYVDYAVKEARALEELGYTGVIIENFGDAPFYKRVRDPLTLATIAIIVREVVKSCGIKVGVNILRNSGREAYAVAVASGAKFIRVNALVETVATDSGVVEAEAPRLRSIRLNYPWVKIYADILVKHGSSLRFSHSLIESLSMFSKGSPEDYYRELVEEYVERGKADALIVTGIKTGEEPPLKIVELTKRHSPIPVLIGSGVTIENVEKFLRISDGVIIGSYIKVSGKAGNPLDFERAKRFIEKVKEVCREAT